MCSIRVTFTGQSRRPPMTERERIEASAGERLPLIAESFERLTGEALVPPGQDLWSMPRAVVAHGTEEVPRFFYGNALALELFAMNAEQFIGLPSHESAEPALREERAAMLARLERDDIVTDYSGVRIAADGRRFRIERAVVWNLLDERGVRHGQAASFAVRTGDDDEVDGLVPGCDTLARMRPGWAAGSEVPIPIRQLEADLVAARNALRESDARFNALADALPHMVWSTLPDGFHDYFNQRWYDFTGMPQGSTDGEEWNGMFHPDDRELAWERWRHSLETGEPYEIEYRLRHRSGEYRWTLGRALPIRGANGEIVRWMGTCTDIDEAKRHADKVEILSRELSHRIKNIFAVIRSLVSLSARQQPEHKTFADGIKERIAALGRAHEFVRPHSEESRPQVLEITLHGLVRQILAPYPALDEGRITVEGDDIKVDDRSATPLALLIHELATNATKYGALAVDEGRVAITTQAAGDTFLFHWVETEGPRVAQPSKTGFGTTLCDISMHGQLGGELEWDWKEDGLSVSARVPRRSLDRGSA